MKTPAVRFRPWFLAGVLGCGLAGQAPAYMLFEGDGSDEPGFVAPRVGTPPPPPPAQISSAETYIPYPGPPVVPQARSEKKKPPTPPVMFTKIRSEHGPLDWAARPNDLNNLLKSMKDMADVHFTMEVKSFGEIDVDPEKNPILYRSGHFHFELSPRQRARLREYLLKGGMLVLNTGMGSKPFYDSARRALREIFPEAPVQRLAPDHPIFHSYYDLDRVEYRKGVREAGYTGQAPWLEGVTVHCRTVAVLSRWGMAIGWDALEDESLMGYSIDSARKLGVNIMAYATSQRAWAQDLAQALTFVDASNLSASTLNVAQIMYSGEWKTRHAGLSVLLQQFNQKTGIPVKFGSRELRLTDPELYDMPLLYMTGHEDFELTATEAGHLRRYLQNGGTLFAEACCGRRGFDQAFRREIRKVLPGAELSSVVRSHMLFQMPNPLGRLAVTPALAARSEGPAIEPELLGVELQGHLAVIYSPYGLAGGWEMSQNPYAFGYANSACLRLGENILMYTITH